MKVSSGSIVLLSGGLDSAANLAIACEDSVDQPILALTARYGQRAADREVAAAASLCEYYGVRHQVVELPWLGALGGSSLTDASVRVPDIGSHELDNRTVTESSARAVWVPNRNGILINVAAAWAERLQASCVVVGFNREEAATFPDNSKDYLDRAARALELSTSNGVHVVSYTVHQDKREIVARLRSAMKKAFPFDRVWSCYHGGVQACGVCESCRRYARAVSS